MSYSLPLQKALFESLSAEGLTIFDTVPKGASFPYVSFGPSDETEDDADCIEAVRVSQQIDVWSRKPGSVEAKHLSSIIRNALHRREILLDGAALVEIEVQNIRIFRDPDGVTTHAVITLLSTIERSI